MSMPEKVAIRLFCMLVACAKGVMAWSVRYLFLYCRITRMHPCLRCHATHARHFFLEDAFAEGDREKQKVNRKGENTHLGNTG